MCSTSGDPYQACIVSLPLGHRNDTIKLLVDTQVIRTNPIGMSSLRLYAYRSRQCAGGILHKPTGWEKMVITDDDLHSGQSYHFHSARQPPFWLGRRGSSL